MGFGAKLYLKEPISEEVKMQIIEEFDSRNIKTGSGDWWGTAIEEDKPSYGVKPEKDGSLYIGGMDFTEGKIGTHLSFSGDRKIIEVDRDWNLDDVEAVLNKNEVLYNKRFPKSPEDFHKYGEPVKATLLGLIGDYRKHPRRGRISLLKEMMGFRGIKIPDDEMVRTLDLMVGERLISKSKRNGDEIYDVAPSGESQLLDMRIFYYL